MADSTTFREIRVRGRTIVAYLIPCLSLIAMLIGAAIRRTLMVAKE